MVSAAWRVLSSGHLERAINAGLPWKEFTSAYGFTARYPCPFIARRLQLPKVVEPAEGIGRIVAISPKQPNVTATVCPTDRARAGARQVSGRGDPQGTVDAGFASHI